MRINFKHQSIAVGCMLAIAHTAVWADLIIAPGGQNSLTSGFESLACTNLSVSGLLNINSGSLVLVKNSQITAGGVIDGGSGIIEVNGSWGNAGTFNAGTGTVKLTHACGVDTIPITGQTPFGNLVIDSQNGPLHIVLPPNTVQTVSGSLSFSGSPTDIYIDGGPCSGIQLLGNAPPGGQDSNVHLAPGVWVGTTPPSTCPGGGPPILPSNVPIPTTNGFGLALLSALLAAAGAISLVWRKRKHRQR